MSRSAIAPSRFASITPSSAFSTAAAAASARCAALEPDRDLRRHPSRPCRRTPRPPRRRAAARVGSRPSSCRERALHAAERLVVAANRHHVDARAQRVACRARVAVGASAPRSCARSRARRTAARGFGSRPPGAARGRRSSGRRAIRRIPSGRSEANSGRVGFGISACAVARSPTQLDQRQPAVLPHGQQAGLVEPAVEGVVVTAGPRRTTARREPRAARSPPCARRRASFPPAANSRLTLNRSRERLEPRGGVVDLVGGDDQRRLQTDRRRAPWRSLPAVARAAPGAPARARPSRRPDRWRASVPGRERPPRTIFRPARLAN